MSLQIWVIGRGLYALNFAKIMKGENLCLLTTDPNDFAGWSNSFSKVVYLKFNPLTYFNDVCKIVGQDIIYIIGEETLYLEYHNKFTPKLNMKSSISKIKYHNKANFMKLVKKSKIPLIETYYPFKLIQQINTQKFLLKPIYSRGSIGQEVITLNLGQQYIVPENYILQKYLDNKTEYSIFATIESSIILDIICYKCECMHKGFSTKRTVIGSGNIIAKLLTQRTQTLLQNMSSNYDGFIGIDFLESGGIFYPTDCNPRVTNGISFYTNPSSDSIISLVPYLKQNFSCSVLVECYTTTNDMFSLADPLPGLFAIFMMIYYVLCALCSGKNVEKYIEKKVQEQIVVFDAPIVPLEGTN